MFNPHNVLFIVLASTFVLGCGDKAAESPKPVAKNKREVRDDTLGINPVDGLLRVQNESDPFTGVSVAYYPGGEREFRRSFLNGKPHGLTTYWSKKGEEEREETWKKGEKVGEVFKGTLGAKLAGIRRDRTQLNRTVWAGEEAAQAHEETFIKFWDSLREAKDKWAVFKKFRFGRLTLKQPQPPNKLDWGITLREFGGAITTVSVGDWGGFLGKLEARGITVVETEWHQEAFELGNPGSSKSIFNFVIHAIEGESNRHILRGKLAIEWAAEKDESGHYMPSEIVVRGMQVLSRAGKVPFKEDRLIDPYADRFSGPSEPSAMPLLVHDLDGDGLSEIILPGSNLAYHNRGGWQFDKKQLCNHPMVNVQGAVLADFSGDGTVDLLIMVNGRAPVIYEGTVDGRFPHLPRPLQVGESSRGFSYACAVGDIDGDRDLDVWVTQYKPPYVGGQFPTPYYDSNDGWPSYLLKNNGNGRFTVGTLDARLADLRYRRTYSASFVDVDGDRDLDLVTVNDFAGLDVHLNNGSGRFGNDTGRLGENRHSFGMSHALADFNGDGKLDMYMTGMGSTTARRLETMGAGRQEFAAHQQKRMKLGYGSRLLLGDRNGFRQAENNDQVARTGWSWGCTAFDFDNDGDRDLYIANGNISSKSCRDYCTEFWRHDIYTGSSRENRELQLFYNNSHRKFAEVSWNGFEHNVLFMNEGKGEFRNVGFLLGLSHEYDSRSIVSDDLDGDGRPDLLVVEQRWLPGSKEVQRQYVHVLRNEWPGKNHWIGVRLRGRMGQPVVGARVELRLEGRTEQQPVVTGDSFAAQHSFEKHFGLGKAESVEALVVHWPDGSTSRRPKPAIDQYHTVSPE